MKNLINFLKGHKKSVAALAIATIAGTSQLAAQNLEGWVETSIGKPTGNARLYPSINIGKHLKAQALWDFNGYFSFGKTDLTTKEGYNTGPLTVKPVLTLNTSPFGNSITSGPNVSYGGKRGFGFAEASINPTNLEESTFYTYNSLNVGSEGSRIALFTASPINNLNIKSTYSELETTGYPFGETGISPYMRTTFNGTTPVGFQAGISVNPRQTGKWLRGKGHRNNK